MTEPANRRKEAQKASRVWIGTSGWSYTHWRERFYPRGLAGKHWLSHYSRAFPTVEINATFYRLPKTETVTGWREQTPEGFLFAVKASRYITHILRLGGAADAWHTFAERIGPLEDKLGPLLFQLPPQMAADPERLKQFLALLPRGGRYTLEFRHQSWFDATIYRILERNSVALCLSSSPTYPLVDRVTAHFVFVRMHGGQVLYGSRYSTGELCRWADRLAEYADGGLDCYVYFNNDAFAFAVENARELTELLVERLGSRVVLGAAA